MKWKRAVEPILIAAVAAVVAVGLVIVDRETASDRYPGAGPVLVDALNEGWSPLETQPKPGTVHECDMCGVSCCTRCNTKDMCCCLSVTHCACPPDAWGGGSPELRAK